ncbi:hypothetical protein [Sulfurirhabdus autotrophica]|uniref:hypothetical protein n=1 Tax=Sulfurirhabdus autotrophica TaxID=1706046 RepID=UPI000F61088E|nr:hypothetical protein [Sulfurirhabdus autotrophica]
MIHFIIEELAAGLVFDLGDRGIIPPHIGADRGAGAGAAGFGNQVTLQVIMVDGGLCSLGRIYTIKIAPYAGCSIKS